MNSKSVEIDKSSIVFVNPGTKARGLNLGTVYPQLGLMYMAACLERAGYSCRIIDAYVLGLSVNEVIAEIRKSPDLFLLGAYVNSYTYSYVRNMFNTLEFSYGVIRVVGGPVPSAAPQQVLADLDVDAVVVGEGEEVIVDVARHVASQLPLRALHCPGLYVRDMSHQPLPAKRITDLDSLPFPAFHLVPPLSNYRSRARKTPVAGIVLSRGCYYNCTFCMRSVYPRGVTFRSAGNAMEEIESLRTNYGVRQIDILDDNFTSQREFAEEFLDEILHRNWNLCFNLQSGVRVENIDEALLAKMKRAGFYKISFGIESADENVLKLNHKHLYLDKCRKVIKWARKKGLLTYGFFIVGLPGESNRSIQATIDFVKETKIDFPNFMIATPFIGTPLFKMVEKRGAFTVPMGLGIDAGMYQDQAFFTYPDFTVDDVKHWYRKLYRECYRPHKMAKLLLTVQTVSEFKSLVLSALPVITRMFGEPKTEKPKC